MTLTPEMCLRGVIDALQDRILPTVSDRYAGEAARLASLVLTITTNSIDDAAAIRFDENTTLRTLFREAEGVVDDAELVARLAQAANAPDPGLRLSALDGENAKLRGLLVELHAAAEDQPDDNARALCGRIWRLLEDFEVARAPRR